MKKALLLALPALAALPLIAGSAAEAKKKAPAAAAAITGGSYTIEPTHTLIGWRVNHFGFNDYFGLFGDPSGTLELDKAKLSNSRVEIELPIKNLFTASAKLTENMLGDEFFKADKYPTARFVSTKVKAKGNAAKIEGKLTMLGVTKSITLDAKLGGAGTNAYSGKENVGFHATATLKRSDFGMVYGLPMVGDEVTLDISAAFQKK